MESEEQTNAGGFQSTSVIWRVASVTFFIGYLCHVISFGTPYWITLTNATGTPVNHVGIWNNCTGILDCRFVADTSTCINAVRVFGAMALVIGSLVLLLLVGYVKAGGRRRGISVTCITLCFIQALLVQVSLAVYGRSTGCMHSAHVGQTTWSWSMALSLASVVLFSAAGFSFLGEQLRRCSKGDNSVPDDKPGRQKPKRSNGQHRPVISDWS